MSGIVYSFSNQFYTGVCDCYISDNLVPMSRFSYKFMLDNIFLMLQIRVKLWYQKFKLILIGNIRIRRLVYLNVVFSLSS